MRFFSTLILSVFCCALVAQKPPSPQEVENYLDAFAANQLEAFKIPGLSIGVMQEGKVVYAKSFGVQSIATEAPMTTKSLFHMASVSKPFVATALVIAEAEGLLGLDDKLVDHLPYFKMATPAYKEITLRQMLAHTSGIPDVEDYDWGNPDVSDAAVEAYSKSFSEVELDFPPGTDNRYSNAAFDLLADVIMKTSGMTFEEYVSTRILKPIGMEESAFAKPAIDPTLATDSHIPTDALEIGVNPIYPYNRIHAPSSSLHSNVDDMLRWAKLYLGKGEIDGNTILTPAQYEALTTVNYQPKKGTPVCLSWFKAKAHGDDFFVHSGGDPGFRTFFGFIPAQGYAIAVMGNSDLVRSSQLAGIITAYVLKGKERDWPKPPIHLGIGKIMLREGITAFREAWVREANAKPSKYEVEPHYLDDLGYRLIDGGHPEKAVDVFKFMVELEPKEAGWYDSVGDAYRALGNTEAARKWYTIASEKGFAPSFEKLKELE
ncbi:MAG: serine hydrolase domain-containing protein [Bacteroidota bacterium]